MKLESWSLHFLQNSLLTVVTKGVAPGKKKGFYSFICYAQLSKLCIWLLLVYYSSFDMLFFLLSYCPHWECLLKKKNPNNCWIILSGVWNVPENVILTIHVLTFLIISIQNCFQTANSVIKNVQCVFCQLDTDPNNNDVTYSVIFTHASSAMCFSLLLFFIKSVWSFNIRKMRNWCA